MIQKLWDLLKHGEKLGCVRFSKINPIFQIPSITSEYLVELFDFGAYRLCEACHLDCDNCEYSNEELEEDENYYWRHEEEIEIVKEIGDFLTDVIKMEYVSNNYCIIGDTAFYFNYYTE